MNGEPTETRDGSDPILPIIDRYLAGLASADDRSQVERWLASSAEGRAELAAMQSILTTPPRKLRVAEDVIARANAILGHDQNTEMRGNSGVTPAAGAPLHVPGKGSRVGKRTFQPGRHSLFAGLCGILAILVVGSGVMRHLTSPGSTRQIMQRYTAAMGTVRELMLPDSSRITLAPGTTLTVANGFGKTHREVSLSGRAYFTIRQAEGVPFIVTTGAVTTRVLGTAFDITHYTNDRDVRVLVTQGKVNVATTTSHATRTLTAGTLGHITDSSIVATTVDDAASYTEWTRGRLVFHGARVSEVIAGIEQWYGLTIRLADPSLARRRLNVKLDFESASDVIATLEVLLDVTASYDTTKGTPRIVTFVPRRAPASPTRNNSRQNILPSHMEVGR